MRHGCIPVFYRAGRGAFAKQQEPEGKKAVPQPFIPSLDHSVPGGGGYLDVYFPAPVQMCIRDRIVEDINHTLSEEAARRNIPPITLSAGAVIAHGGDSYTELAKLADAEMCIRDSWFPCAW